MAEYIDPGWFNECVDMETATAAVQAAGGSEEAVHVVHDLVKSGSYIMPTVFQEGGYAILRITPIIATDDGLKVEPLELGANQIMPDLAEWSREATRSLMVGNEPMTRRAKKKMLTPDRNKKALNRIFRTSAWAGGVKIDEICDAVSDTPSRMLGGIVSGIQIDPVREWGGWECISPFWHRAIPLSINSAHILGSLPKFMGRKIEPIIGDPDIVGGMALVHLFGQVATQQEALEVNAHINLRLPPAQFMK